MANAKVDLSHELSNEEEKYSSFALSILTSAVTPLVLQAVLELDIFEIIKKLGPYGAQFSAKEIAAQLPAKNPEAAAMLDRMLRLLASHSVVSCTLTSLGDGSIERKYGLTPVCKYFTKDEKGVSLAVLADISKFTVDSSYQLKETILQGGDPFERAYGASHYVYLGQNPELNEKFNSAMTIHSTLIMEKILKVYKGFEGISSIVDVGGGNGTTLKMIISKYPTIKGINFDLPHVINNAPPCHGVEHVAGSMFDSVPKADVVFLKWICHAWTDEKCIELLKNCYEAIPNNGKVVICECLLPEEPNTSEASKYVFQLDVCMMVVPNGKERTLKEFRALAKLVGFQGFKVICSAYQNHVLEFLKTTI